MVALVLWLTKIWHIFLISKYCDKFVTIIIVIGNNHILRVLRPRHQNLKPTQEKTIGCDGDSSWMR